MRVLQFAAFLALCAGATARPVLHLDEIHLIEKEAQTFAKADLHLQPAKKDAMHKFTIALVHNQDGVDQLEAKVLDISDPTSPRYGQWLNQQEVLAMVAPPADVADAVVRALTEKYFIPAENVQSHGDHVVVQASIRQVEQLFKVDMMADGFAKQYNYKMPEELAPHVVFVEGIAGKKIDKKPKVPAADDELVGREVLQRLYTIPDSMTAEGASVCVAEFQGGGSYLNSDLTLSQKQNGQKANPITKPHSIGENDPMGEPDVETSLDMQMVSAVADGAELWYWNEPQWLYSFSTAFFKAKVTPDVVSMSYGWSEYDQCSIAGCNDTQAYVARVNTEFLKMTSMGKTLVVSSGDSGSTGRTNPGCTEVPHIRPAFPGSSPWVVSVGATALEKKGEVPVKSWKTPLCNNPENACATGTQFESAMFDGVGWCSGAGFSAFGKLQPFQKNFTAEYLASGVGLPKKFMRANRGAVDITANGHACATFTAGDVQSVDGTSCSAPTVAGMFGLLNAHMKATGKSTIGLVTPMLYHIAATSKGVFTKVPGNTASNEGGDCPATAAQSNFGFFSSPETLWDPVAGLGYPNVEKLAAAIDAVLEKQM